MSFKEHLDAQTYDKYYQDIEHIGFEGYAKSSKSWDNIKDLVDWKDKDVVDIGCFHGYYCFKAEEAGAKNVAGIDRNADTLVTTAMIAKERNSKCQFYNMSAEDTIIDADILLCLNVFHHIPKQEEFLQSILAEQVIFEIDKEDLPKIEKYCNIEITRLSHRPSSYTGDVPNRLVLLATMKEPLEATLVNPK